MKKLFIILLVLLLGVGGVVFVKREFIMTSLKTRRAAAHLVQAQAALDEGNSDRAWNLAVSANQLHPGDIEALRLLLRSRSPQLSRHLYKITTMLIEHPHATLEDKAGSLAVYLLFQDFRRFTMYYRTLTEEEKKDTEVRLHYAHYLILNGAPEQALRMLDQIPEENERSRFLRAAILAKVTEKTVAARAQRELAALMTSENRHIAMGAMRAVGAIPVDRIEVEIMQPAVESWMAKHKSNELSIIDHLIRQNVAIADADGDEQRRSTVVKQTIDQFGKDHPVEVVNWMVNHGLTEDALALADEAAETVVGSDQQVALFDVRLNALERAGEWQKVSDLLRHAPSGVSPMRLAAKRGEVADHLGKKSTSLVQWQKAWDLAKGDSPMRNSFLDLYRIARRANKLDLAADAMIEASKSPHGILPATEELTAFMIYLVEQKRTNDLEKVTNQFLTREVYSPDLINNALYLRELAGIQEPRALALIKTLEDRFPGVIGLSTTRIVMHINRGETEEALTVAERLSESYEKQKLPPVEALIIAGAYRKSGRSNAIFESNLAEKLNSVMKIEQEFYQPWFQ